MKKILTFIFLSFLLTNLPTQATDLTDLFDASYMDSSIVTSMSSPELRAYTLVVGKKIISHFQMPQTNENLSTIIIFTIDKNGKLINYEINQYSGNEDYDTRVISAIKKSAPFPAPTFQNENELTIVLNMNLSIIKLIKMLSSEINLNDLLNNPSLLDVPQEDIIPDTKLIEKQQTPHITKEKKFLYPKN